VTFGALAAASTLAGFPQLQAAGSAPLGNGPATIGQKGALLTAVASILRYRQNRGDLPSPNGLADAGALNQFLQSLLRRRLRRATNSATASCRIPLPASRS
jgi:hypothetical protein